MTETAPKDKKVEDIKKIAEETIKCPVRKALYYMEEFLSGPMCGKCFPCAMGSYEAKVRLINIVSGRGGDSDIHALKLIASHMLETSRCKRGKDTAEFMLEWLSGDAYAEHLKGRCLNMECKALMEYRIIPDECTVCGLCKDACKYNAIIGEKRVSHKSGYLPFEIRQIRCVKCGDCVDVCPEKAIEVVSVSSEKEKALAS